MAGPLARPVAAERRQRRTVFHRVTPRTLDGEEQPVADSVYHNHVLLFVIKVVSTTI